MMESRHPEIYWDGLPPLSCAFLRTQARTIGTNLSWHCAFACSIEAASASPEKAQAAINAAKERQGILLIVKFIGDLKS
jgi:hypothetical protein